MSDCLLSKHVILQRLGYTKESQMEGRRGLCGEEFGEESKGYHEKEGRLSK